MDWTRINYFKQEEFDSPDMPGSGANMQQEFVEKLDTLRDVWGPLSVTSGYRTVRHNAIVGGVPDSAHVRGLAADLATPDLKTAIKLALVACRVGFDRIGINLKGTFVHVDLDPSLPSPATWFYGA